MRKVETLDLDYFFAVKRVRARAKAFLMPPSEQCGCGCGCGWVSAEAKCRAKGRWPLAVAAACRFGGGCSHHCRLIIFIITLSSPRRRSTKVSRCETLLLLPSPRLHQPFHRSTLGLLRGIPAQAVCPRVPTPLFTQFSPALANESEDTVPARRFEEAASSPRFGFLAARPSYTSLPRLAGSHHSRLPLACLCHCNCNCHGRNFTSPVLASICRQPTTF